MAVESDHIERPALREAKRFVRKMRGGTQASLVETECGRQFVVKASNNPWGPRVLINEVLVNSLLRQLCIATPMVSYVRFSDEFIDAHPELWLRSSQGSIRPVSGIHFGSEVPSARSIYDFLPDVLLDRVANLRSFWGALVLDQWVSNVDARQAILVRGDHGFEALFIDNEQCFAGERWAFWDTPLQGLYVSRRVYRGIRTVSDFDEWLDRAANLPESVLTGTVQHLPDSWISGTGECDRLDQLITRLLLRRRRLPSLMQQVGRKSGALLDWALPMTKRRLVRNPAQEGVTNQTRDGAHVELRANP